MVDADSPEALAILRQLSAEDQLKAGMDLMMYGTYFVERTETGYKYIKPDLVSYNKQNKKE